MTKLSLERKKDIENTYLNVRLSTLKRSAPKGRYYADKLYKLRHTFSQDGHTYAYINDDEPSIWLAGATDYSEQVALADCLAQIEMQRQEALA